MVSYLVVGQNLRYLFSRDYHLFKRLLKVTGGTRFWPIAISWDALPAPRYSNGNDFILLSSAWSLRCPSAAIWPRPATHARKMTILSSISMHNKVSQNLEMLKISLTMHFGQCPIQGEASRNSPNSTSLADVVGAARRSLQLRHKQGKIDLVLSMPSSALNFVSKNSAT